MERLSLFTNKIFGRYAIIARYFMSGGSAFATNIIALFFLTEYLGIHYLISAAVAFFSGFIVSFFMMKYWTFQDTSTDGAHRQIVIYFLITIFNLLLNTSIIFILVEFVGVWYIFAQVFASLFIAISSFFIYKKIIFTNRNIS